MENDENHLNDLKKCQSSPTTKGSHYHLGQNLLGHSSSLEIISDFVEKTILNTPSSGKWKRFVVGSSNISMESEIANCVSLGIDQSLLLSLPSCALSNILYGAML